MYISTDQVTSDLTYHFNPLKEINELRSNNQEFKNLSEMRNLDSK